jgi:phosphohistidine phosphatase
MKTLLVLRHAKSSWNDTSLDDHERPLNKRGRRDGPRMGELVREHRLTPDIIISSDAVRARRTAEAVAEAARYAGEIVLDSGEPKELT